MIYTHFEPVLCCVVLCCLTCADIAMHNWRTCSTSKFPYLCSPCQQQQFDCRYCLTAQTSPLLKHQTFITFCFLSFVLKRKDQAQTVHRLINSRWRGEKGKEKQAANITDYRNSARSSVKILLFVQLVGKLARISPLPPRPISSRFLSATLQPPSFCVMWKPNRE